VTDTPSPELAGLALLRRIGAELHPDQGVVVADGNGRVLLATPAARQLLALPNDCEGRAIGALGADPRLVRIVESCADQGRQLQREISTAEADLVFRAFPAEPMSRSVIVLIRDETRTRRLQRVRRDFVTNVSHELRTPITAIRLLVDTLEKGALHDPEAATTFVHSIGLEVRHLAQMVEELLQLSTLESGERGLDMGMVALGPLFDSVDRLRPLAQERGVVLALEVAPATPPIRGDADRLSDVVRNLVHNAIKFTPASGSITISARPLDSGRRVELRCADSGVGIRTEDMPRIFERFWKADSSRLRDGEGSGLGLAICRHIVEAHGGSIRVESEPRQGTTFIVELPAVMVPAAES